MPWKEPRADSDAVSRTGATARAKRRSSAAKARSAQRSTGKRWTKDEDAVLRRAVEELGTQDWPAVSQDFFGGKRTESQCMHRYTKVLSPGLVKGPWMPEEDRVIVACMNSGVTKWSDIAERIPGRMGKQCRERWYNHLDPALKKTPWTAEEDRILRELQAGYGNRWSIIAKYLPGRSENSVKNRWNSALRRLRGRGKAKEGGGQPAVSSLRSMRRAATAASERQPTGDTPRRDGRPRRAASSRAARGSWGNGDEEEDSSSSPQSPSGGLTGAAGPAGGGSRSQPYLPTLARGSLGRRGPDPAASRAGRAAQWRQRPAEQVAERPWLRATTTTATAAATTAIAAASAATLTTAVTTTAAAPTPTAAEVAGAVGAPPSGWRPSDSHHHSSHRGQQGSQRAPAAARTRARPILPHRDDAAAATTLAQASLCGPTPCGAGPWASRDPWAGGGSRRFATAPFEAQEEEGARLFARVALGQGHAVLGGGGGGDGGGGEVLTGGLRAWGWRLAPPQAVKEEEENAGMGSPHLLLAAAAVSDGVDPARGATPSIGSVPPLSSSLTSSAPWTLSSSPSPYPSGAPPSGAAEESRQRLRPAPSASLGESSGSSLAVPVKRSRVVHATGSGEQEEEEEEEEEEEREGLGRAVLPPLQGRRFAGLSARDSGTQPRSRPPALSVAVTDAAGAAETGTLSPSARALRDVAHSFRAGAVTGQERSALKQSILRGAGHAQIRTLLTPRMHRAGLAWPDAE